MLEGVLTADELGVLSDALKEDEDKISRFYAENTGLTYEKADELMSIETNLNEQQLAEYGFIIKQNLYNMNGLNSILAKIKNLGGGEGNTNLTLSLEDGTEIFVVTEDGVLEGNQVLIGDNPAPDGSHTLSDGRVITVEAGVITAVADAVASTEGAEGEGGAVSREEFNNLVSNVTNVESTLNEVKGAINSLAALFEDNKIDSMIENKVNVVASKSDALDDKFKVLADNMYEALKQVGSNFEVPKDTTNTDVQKDQRELTAAEKVLGVARERRADGKHA
jgi:hypothetical protein